MSATRYRIIFAMLGLGLAAVVAGAVIFAPSGNPTDYPDVVESVSPAPGTLALPQTELRIDLRPNYRIELFVDGVRIPDDEIAVVAPTGLHTWAPAPGSNIEQWIPGPHSVLIRWDTIAGFPDPGDFGWTFRTN